MRLAAATVVVLLATLLSVVAWANPYDDANAKFVDACGGSNPDHCEPLTAERTRKWQEVGPLYEAAVDADPNASDAPGAVMRAAFCFAQVGDATRAIQDYERVINDYGKEDALSKLQASAPARYAERVRLLEQAYENEATAHEARFAYPKADALNVAIATRARFGLEPRRRAAKTALILATALGERDRVLAISRLVTSLSPTAVEKASFDYLVASFDYQRWDASAPDTGSNQTARVAATSALSSFYQSNRANPAAAKYALEASWRVARMKKAAADGAYHDWYGKAVAAWAFLKNTAPTDADSAPYADYGAEAEFVPLDEEIRANFDYDTGHEHYVTMSAADLLGLDPRTGQKIKAGRFDSDVAAAKQFDARLARIVSTYKSDRWVAAALAREGTLFDSLRTGLYSCAGWRPSFQLLSPRQTQILTMAANSGNSALINAAANIVTTVPPAFAASQKSLDDADSVMVRDYAQSIAYAREHGVTDPWTAHATARLAYFTQLFGDSKMSAYVTATPAVGTIRSRKLSYVNGMYTRMRAALPTPLPVTGAAPPAPPPP